MTTSRVVQFDAEAREMTLKVVYYGPPHSGKATNLTGLHEAARPETRGRIMTLDAGDDRTLCFDLLPLSSRPLAGAPTLRIKVFTVPTDAIHHATRRLVLLGADGVVFVADSQRSETESNAAAFLDLCENVKSNGGDVASLPLVIQFNKRDLPDVRSEAELSEIAALGREPVFMAVANRGEGIAQTFLGLLRLTWLSLNESHKLDERFGLTPDDLLAAVASGFGGAAGDDPLARGPAAAVGQIAP